MIMMAEPTSKETKMTGWLGDPKRHTCMRTNTEVYIGEIRYTTGKAIGRVRSSGLRLVYNVLRKAFVNWDKNAFTGSHLWLIASWLLVVMLECLEHRSSLLEQNLSNIPTGPFGPMILSKQIHGTARAQYLTLNVEWLDSDLGGLKKQFTKLINSWASSRFWHPSFACPNQPIGITNKQIDFYHGCLMHTTITQVRFVCDLRSNIDIILLDKDNNTTMKVASRSGKIRFFLAKFTKLHTTVSFPNSGESLP